MAKLRYGLIGTGMMGYEHINNFEARCPEAEIAVAITDSGAAVHSELAQAFLGDGLKRPGRRSIEDRAASCWADPAIDAVFDFVAELYALPRFCAM